MISIIIPVYNVENYIKQCLVSIFNQTYRNFELIIVNDGSTDNSEKIINEFCKQYENIIYVYQDNQGVASARNNALKYITGNFVAFIDPDDYIEENYLEYLYNNINENKSEVAICGYREIYDDDIEGKENIINFEKFKKDIFVESEIINLLLQLELNGFLWNKLFRITDNFYSSMCFPKNKLFEDYFPVFKCLSNCKKISIIKKPLYNYRKRGSSYLNSKENEVKRMDDFVTITNQILDFTKSKKYYNRLDLVNFKISCFSTTLDAYFKINKNKGIKNYNDFRFNKYNLLEPSLKELYFAKSVPTKTRLLVLLYKIKMAHYIYYFK